LRIATARVPKWPALSMPSHWQIASGLLLPGSPRNDALIGQEQKGLSPFNHNERKEGAEIL
jgi:hypothetical protein